MMKKGKGMASSSRCECSSCHPHIRGKALLNLGIAIVLVLAGFSMVGFWDALKVLGLLFALKGLVQLKCG